MRSSLEREVRGSNLRPVISHTVLPTAHHCCDIFSIEAVLPGRNDPEMGPDNSLHASAYYSEYNERFDINQLIKSFLKTKNTCLKVLLSKSILLNGSRGFGKYKPSIMQPTLCHIERKQE